MCTYACTYIYMYDIYVLKLTLFISLHIWLIVIHIDLSLILYSIEGIKPTTTTTTYTKSSINQHPDLSIPNPTSPESIAGTETEPTVDYIQDSMNNIHLSTGKIYDIRMLHMLLYWLYMPMLCYAMLCYIHIPLCLYRYMSHILLYISTD